MMYAIFADAVVAAHLIYASYVLFGYLLIVAGMVFRWAWVRNFAFRLSHLICTLLVGWEAAGGIICPLTILENRLLSAAGGSGYHRSFFGHLLSTVLYYDAPEWVFAAAYISWSVLVVGTYVIFPPLRVRRK